MPPHALRPLAAALALAGCTWATAQPVRAPQPAASAPIELRANEIRGRPDLEAVAEGDVELRRGTLKLQADWLSYEQVDDLALARGKVRITTPTGIYSGPELRLHVQRFEGFFVQPVFEFLQIGSGGRAARIDFVDNARSVAHQALYTSCPREGPDEPAWVLKADRVQLDFDANEGVADGAVLRFQSVPILALPAMSFPLGEGRKSGWLPPSFDIDTKSGFMLAVPYYWNIAPNRDATFTPRVITKRGFGLDSEFRYLEPGYSGSLGLALLPHDRVAARSRQAWTAQHDARLPLGAYFHADLVRVSDDAWWKDFPNDAHGLTPRLLPMRAELELPIAAAGGRGLAYARVLRWQVLQGSDTPLVAPYERSPQLGLRFGRALGAGLEAELQTEANRFSLPDRDGTATEPTGWRWHAQAALTRPWREPWGWLVPRLSVNAARYSLDQAASDGRRRLSRTIPSFSIDAGLEFERRARYFGRDLRQTLEPRLLYVNTPFRDQSALPNFDSAAKDFNFSSIFSDNSFSGIDRVSDSHQVTAGVTTRLVDDTSGVEALRLGIVQRYLLRTQRVTPEGTPLEQRFSDVFLLGSANVLPSVGLDAALQYNADSARPVRSVVSGRWSPGPYRTVGATYRFTRGLTEQLEVGWQWPLWKSALAAREGERPSAPAGGAGGCGGTWYTVGRVNYSMRDSRVTDSVLGFEYDAGCWIGRIVAERLSTGRSEARTRLLLQLELVGLSRLGSNPLKVLKDNIPGYRLLRDERNETTPAPPPI